MSDMKRLLGAWRPTSSSEPARVKRLPVVTQWEPLPDDIAEWMGMNPYVVPAEQAAAS